MKNEVRIYDAASKAGEIRSAVDEFKLFGKRTRDTGLGRLMLLRDMFELMKSDFRAI